MRRILTIVIILMSILSSGCGNRTVKESVNSGLHKSDSERANLIFKEYEHDFGKVAEGEKLGYIFNFENKGKSDLVILSATTSCGCTVPKYNIKPVSPGENGNLEVIFDTSGRSGMQTKTITVKSNASTPVILLRITAEVVPANSN
jgi:Protein of unknown function (DUF1573)